MSVCDLEIITNKETISSIDTRSRRVAIIQPKQIILAVITILARCRYLSPYYGLPDVALPQSTACGYEAIPTVAAMADVFITADGFVINAKASYNAPKVFNTHEITIKQKGKQEDKR